MVVMKTVGRTTMRATPTINTVKRRATRMPTRRAATRENMKTVIVKTMNITRGKPVRAMFVRRKAASLGLFTAKT